ncbi:MAG TPA: hypothetical protein DDZ96_06040 [Porphyromonadaceae bacterium]|nr:hypothetical protein [Porphyromonadaceae bacterium]HBX21521.1 hypothetical protein [Porphyromonadaceae bacterium]
MYILYYKYKLYRCFSGSFNTAGEVKLKLLYRLTELYKTTVHNGETRKMAQMIISKKIKIQSPVINSIKCKMQKMHWICTTSIKMIGITLAPNCK